MSVTNSDGVDVEVARLHSGGDGFNGPVWSVLHPLMDTDERFARDFAMLVLTESCGWPLESVSKAFGIHRGHCGRRVRIAQRQAAEALAKALPADEIIDGDDEPTDVASFFRCLADPCHDVKAEAA